MTLPSSRNDSPRTRDRSRTFRPNYLTFAGTYQCNLTCAHCCVPIEWPDHLDIGTALRSYLNIEALDRNAGIDNAAKNSKVIDKVEVVRSTEVRRSKLYYLRGLKGKAARLREVERA